MRIWRWIFVAAAILIGGGELYARFGLGLGTPPLYETHPTMEYRLQANQSLTRFHNLFETNERNMRSPTLIGETRPIWLVLGDNIPFGGGQLDQSELATSRLTNDSRMVANLSAGSWGPANLLAALKENADLTVTGIVVIFNSGDLSDVPTFAPLNPGTHPTHAPVLALTEAIQRYLPRYLPVWLKPAPAPVPTEAQTASLLPEGRKDYAELLAGLAAYGAPVCIVMHPSELELSSAPTDQTEAARREAGLTNFAEMRDLAHAAGIPAVDAGQHYRDAGDASALYLDGLHLTAAGQASLAQAIETCMGSALKPNSIQ